MTGLTEAAPGQMVSDQRLIDRISEDLGLICDNIWTGCKYWSIFVRLNQKYMANLDGVLDRS